MEEYCIVVMGLSDVGKSALTNKFIQGSFVEYHHPTIEDCYRKEFYIDGKQCMLEIVDTGGRLREQPIAMMERLMKNGQGFILVYSITSQTSFYGLHELIDQIKKVTVDVPMVLVGNKVDREREQRAVSKDQGQALAELFNCTFMEASAKSKVNVPEIFHDLVRQIIKKRPTDKTEPKNGKKKLKDNKTSECSLS